jgi:hypothetical protein
MSSSDSLTCRFLILRTLSPIERLVGRFVRG